MSSTIGSFLAPKSQSEAKLVSLRERIGQAAASFSALLDRDSKFWSKPGANDHL